jgi:ABC-2 type transport system permease protein
MAKLWVVIKREYLERIRTKWFLIVTIFGPVFFGTIMIVPSYLSMKGLKEAQVGDIRILDASGTDLGQRMRMRLAMIPGAGASLTRVEVVSPSQLAAAETTATHAVMKKETRGYVVLDSASITKQTARYAGRNSVGETQIIETALSQSLLQQRLEGAGLDPARIDSLTKVRVRLSTEKIDETGRSGSATSSLIFGVVIAFLLYFSIIFYGQNIMRGVLEEKLSRVAEVVLSSVSPDTLLAGKVIGVGAVGLTQQLAWVGSTALLWNFRMAIMHKLGMPTLALTFPPITAGTLAILILFFLLGYSFYASLFAAVGAMAGTMEEAGQAAQPVMLMLVSAVIFLQPVALNPSSRLAEIMSWLPFSAPIIMPIRMSGIQVPWYEIAGSLAGLLAACVFAVWFSARVYRVGLLMTGKRPNLKELMRWLRYA